MFIEKYIPPIFGVYFPNKKRGSTFTPQNTGDYEAEYKKYRREYLRNELRPFGVSPLSKDKTQVHFCVIDVDDHEKTPMTKEEVAEVVNTVKDILQGIPLQEEYTGANNGCHLWFVLDTPYPKELFYKFSAFVKKRVQETLQYELEIFPSKQQDSYWIRLPGLHKNQSSWSFDGENNTLDSSDSRENFMKKATISAEILDRYIQEHEVSEYDLTPPQTSKEEKPMIRPEVTKNFISGIPEEAFPVIWGVVTDGQAYPKENEQICCPFHAESTPSSRIYFDKSTKRKIFTCFSTNCVFYGESDSKGHDGYDLLSWYLLRNFEKSEANLKLVQKFFSEQIVASFLQPYLMAKKNSLTVNYIKLVNDTVFFMYNNTEENAIEMRVGPDDDLYFYEGADRMWVSCETPNEENAKIYHLTTALLTRMVGQLGVYQLNSFGVRQVAQEIRHFVYLQPKFEQVYSYKKMIPVGNGLIDITNLTGENPILIPYEKEHYITKKINVCYKQGATNDLFEKFLERVLPNPSIRQLVLEYIGTCLCPAIEPQQCQFWLGEGQNGKGTLCNLIERIFGNVYKEFALTDLSDKYRTARLRGTFIIIDPDSTMFRINATDVSVLKKITGGDTITGEIKYKSPFSLKYTGGVIVITNNAPTLGEINHAIIRRLVFIPFTQKISKEERVDKFFEKLIEGDGAAGILNILLKNLKNYLDRGSKFEEVAECQLLLQQYAAESDPIMAYLQEVFESDMAEIYNSSKEYASAERLTKEKLLEGVSSDLLFSDFQIFCKTAGVARSASFQGISLTKFRKVFKEKLSISKYKEYYSSDRKTKGFIYSLKIEKFLEEKGGLLSETT